MDRVWINYLVDLGLLITLILIVTTGLLRFSELQAIFGINYAALAQSLPIYILRLIHDWSGITFVALSVIHIALNWKIMVSNTKRVFGRGNR